MIKKMLVLLMKKLGKIEGFWNKRRENFLQMQRPYGDSKVGHYGLKRGMRT
jgi:hypothetical protein